MRYVYICIFELSIEADDANFGNRLLKIVMINYPNAMRRPVLPAAGIVTSGKRTAMQ